MRFGEIPPQAVSEPWMDPHPAGEDPWAPGVPPGSGMPPASPGQRPGTVSLVGGGPGDPELLTVRALRRLREADAVVFDALVGPQVLALANPAAQRLYVGKQARNHSLPQPEINELLVRLARQGLRVVRLKGGDPYVFGRGGEEAEHLVAHGVPFEVVPGITSAAGAASCAGIPLTHRDHAHACVFVTGHLCDEGSVPDWAALARPRQTVVVYMGLGAVARIVAQLVGHGLPADTPAAVVERATTPAQRVATATLDTLARTIEREGIRPPALLIIGEVVRLRAVLGEAVSPAHEVAQTAG